MHTFLPMPGRRAALLLALLAGTAAALARPLSPDVAPPPGQPLVQPLVQPLTQERVAAQAAGVYAGRVSALDAAGKLDPAAAFTARVRRVAAGLIAQAARDYPETAAWRW
ncbi:MAG TPA: hypothetical protein VJ752_02395, partial [Burkholderiaceae bacterium]|nr:hypothetical protein [Burkholderiaceae bacterium]